MPPCLLGPCQFSFLIHPRETWHKVLGAWDKGHGEPHCQAFCPQMNSLGKEHTHPSIAPTWGRRAERAPRAALLRSHGPRSRSEPFSLSAGLRGTGREAGGKEGMEWGVHAAQRRSLLQAHLSPASRGHALPRDHLQPAAPQCALGGLGHGGLQLPEPRTPESAGETSPHEPCVLTGESHCSPAMSCVTWAAAHPLCASAFFSQSTKEDSGSDRGPTPHSASGRTGGLRALRRTPPLSSRERNPRSCQPNRSPGPWKAGLTQKSEVRRKAQGTSWKSRWVPLQFCTFSSGGDGAREGVERRPSTGAHLPATQGTLNSTKTVDSAPLGSVRSALPINRQTSKQLCCIRMSLKQRGEGAPADDR